MEIRDCFTWNGESGMSDKPWYLDKRYPAGLVALGLGLVFLAWFPQAWFLAYLSGTMTGYAIWGRA